MDRHALAPRDEALDRIAGDRVAAAGEPDEEVADALDPDPAGLRRLELRRDRRQRQLGVVDDAQAHDDGLRADGAVADRGEEVVEVVVVELPGDLEDPVVAERCDRGPGEAPELAVERLPAVDDVLVTLLALEPLADLLASVARPDEVQPVARRAVLGLGRDDLDDVAVLQPVVERARAGC